MHTTTLVGHEPVAEGTMLFRFARPDGFTYQAGQTVDITLQNPPYTDAEGNMRTFSLVSAPHEADLMFATRMRESAFKRSLGEMAPGTAFTFDGPFGSFLLHENIKRPALFLSGGIGITPFYSMIKDAAHRTLPHQILLFYSNRRPEDTAFLLQLQALEKENPNFKLIATMTDMAKSAQPWDGEQGYIDQKMLEKYTPAGSMPVYYLAGPATMVAAMRTLLTGMGVSGDDIKFEEFAGY